MPRSLVVRSATDNLKTIDGGFALVRHDGGGQTLDGHFLMGTLGSFPQRRRFSEIAITLGLLGLHLLMVGMGWYAGWLWGGLGLALLGLTLTGCTLVPSCRLFGSAVRRVPCATRSVVVTIDDGPSDDTDEILRLLARHHVRAVFFLIGDRAAQRPDDVRRIVAAGHVVGNHTQTHPSHWYWGYPPWRQRHEVDACQQVLTKILGRAPTLFRAPAGFRNPYCNLIASEFGLTVVGWLARGFDGVKSPVEMIIRKLRRGLAPGAIVLVHQGMPHSPEVVAKLLEMLESDGWATHLPEAWLAGAGVAPASDQAAENSGFLGSDDERNSL